MNRRYWLTAAVMTAGVWGLTIALYSRLPEQIPFHWNLRGEPDGFGARQWAAFLSPAFMLVVLEVFAILPVISPRSFDVDSFRATYLYIMVLMTGLFGFIQAVTLDAVLRPSLDAGRVLGAGVFVFMALMGNVMGRVRKNFYIGVHVPCKGSDFRRSSNTTHPCFWR